MASYEDEPKKGKESDSETKGYKAQGKKVGYDKCSGVEKSKADSQLTEDRVTVDPSK